MADKVVGIDLGTTNTVCSIVEGGEPVVIEDDNMNVKTPSVVSFKDNQEKIVGRPALNQAVSKPDKTIKSVKRRMGREDFTFNMGFDEFTPEEISAMILQKVKTDIRNYIGEPVEDAVITVPAYFTDKQRKATMRAGEIAGLNVKRIINEPTAAAIAYGLDKNQDQVVLVADLGGGTFDVSILELGNGIFDVVATDGVRHLGGDDWDKEIVDYIAEEFNNEHRINLLSSPDSRERLHQAAEEAKINLTTQHTTTINIPFIATDGGQPLHIETTLSRDTFDDITLDLLRQLKDPINDTIDRANIRKREIDNVILVGGSTKMPQVKRKLREVVGKQPKTDINPDEVVSMGAAIQGSIMAGENDDVVLLDVTPRSLGIEVKGGIFEPIIGKNTTIPTKKQKIYTTSEDNQKTVEINVYQGENQIASQNEKLGDFILRGIPEAEAGTPRIKIEFKIDADGLVTVSAEETSSEKAKEITIDRDDNITNEDMEHMKNKSAKYDEASKSDKEKITARRNADEAITHARKALLDQSKTDLTAIEAIEVEEMMNELDEMLDSDHTTTEEIKDQTSDLNAKLGRNNLPGQVNRKESDA